MKTLSAIPIYLALLGMLVGCGGKYSGIGGVAGDATLATLKANERFSQSLNLDDPKDFDDAKRGFIARPSGKITSAAGDGADRFRRLQVCRRQGARDGQPKPLAALPFSMPKSACSR